MKNYQFILDNGTSQETLTVNPAGWEKIGIRFTRNETYHSVLRTVTLPLRFVNISGGGYDFIKTEYDTNGIYSIITVTISERNPDTNDYDLFYVGNIDFKPERFTIDKDQYIEANLVDSQKMELLKAREDTEFNLFNLVSPDNIALTDFPAQRSISLTDIPIVLEADITAVADNLSNQHIARNEIYYGYPEQVTVINNQIGDAITVDGLQATIYTNENTDTAHVTVLVEGTYNYYGWLKTLSGNFWEDVKLTLTYNLVAYNASSIAIQTKLLATETYTLSDGDEIQWQMTGEFPYNPIDIDIPSGGRVDMQCKVHMQGGNDQWYAIASNDDDITHIYFEEQAIGIGATTSNVFYTHEVFTRLLQHITSETTTSKIFRSELFGKTDSFFQTYTSDGDYSRDAWFSGLMCRNTPDAPCNISFKKAFKTIDAIYNIGLGFDQVNDRFYIDYKYKFYDSTYLMFTIDEDVVNFKRTPYGKAYFSSIKAGYDFEGNYKNFGGAYEPNLKSEYIAPTPIKEELDIVAPYRTDSVGIQQTREKQYTTTSSIDTDGDKSIFLVRVTSDNPPIPANTFYVSGFPGVNNYYNQMITPRQNMVRWGDFLKCTLYKNLLPIKYINATKPCNFEYYSDPYTSHSEYDDITQAEMADPLFIPEIYTFESYITPEQLQILLTNPNGYIQFSFRGENYQGYINNLEIGDYNRKATFELIAKDSTKIYRIFEDKNLHIFENGHQKVGESIIYNPS